MKHKHKRGTGFHVGAVLPGGEVVRAYKVRRDDNALLDWYTVRCWCGAQVERSKALLRRKPEAVCPTCAAYAREEGKGADGRSYTARYRAWRSMLDRCADKNNRNYGGRGITVCERWHSFDNFYADMGERPPGHSIERRDNNAGYSPENCYWATPGEQGRNRRTNRLLTAVGETLPESVWCERVGVTRGQVAWRIERGWSVEQACTTPHQRKQKGE